MALDLLRAGSAQLVLLGHAFDFFGVFSFLGEPDPPPQIQRMAVVVFFLLSGFRDFEGPGSHLLLFGCVVGVVAAGVFQRPGLRGPGDGVGSLGVAMLYVPLVRTSQIVP